MQERGNARLKWADRHLGIGALACLRLMRRPRPWPATIDRIGLLKLTALGDTVLLSAVMQDLRAAYPQAEILLFAGPENAQLGPFLDGPSATVLVHSLHPLAMIRRVRSHRLDLMIDCGQWTRLEALTTALSGARSTLGFQTGGQSRHFCQDASVEHSDHVHELENQRNLVRRLGITPKALPSLHPPEQSASSRAPYVVLHPWPGGYRSDLREWPRDRWVTLGRALVQAGLELVLTGGSSDVERSAELATELRDLPVTDTAGTTIGEVLGLLAHSVCVISVNTGIMHAAAALGVPTVGLNGPTSADRWGPVGPWAISVNSRLEGSGFLNLGWEYTGQREDSMTGVEVDAVLTAVWDLVAAADQARSGGMDAAV